MKTLNIDLELSKIQKDILQSEHEINLVFAGRGSGKTAITSIIAILHLLQDRNVIIISPTYQQLAEQNYTEILNFLHKMNLKGIISNKFLSVQYMQKKIRFLTGMVPDRLRGYSSIHTIIFDETANLTHDCYKLAIATQRKLDGLAPKVYIVGTPPPFEEHWVAQMALSRDDIRIFQATANDNPFVEKDYLKKLKKEYMYLPQDFTDRELFGKLVFSGQSNVSLFNDFRIVEGVFDYPESPLVCGLDIAGRGADMTVMCLKKGKQIIDMAVKKTNTDTELKEFVEKMFNVWGFDVLRFDSTGFGHLITFNFPLKVEVQAVNFGGAAGERFVNQRALMYAMLAKEGIIYMDLQLAKKHKQALETELKETRYDLSRNCRRLSIIDKEKIKERIGRSPDRADAVALAFSYEKPLQKPRAIIAPHIFGKY